MDCVGVPVSFVHSCSLSVKETVLLLLAGGGEILQSPVLCNEVQCFLYPLSFYAE